MTTGNTTAAGLESPEAKAAKKAPPARPQQWLTGNSRPGNIFAGVVNPTLGYGIKGVIWYQGESNASRAVEYADLFPFMIEQWRKEWGQGDFSFYWVQLADFKPYKDAPGESDWAELRESQTKTLALAKTGQAVIIDLGEARDIHPRNKYDVASRLVRWALVKDYGLNFPYRSPEYTSAEFTGNRAVVTINCFGSSLRAFDVTDDDHHAGFGLIRHPQDQGDVVGTVEFEKASKGVGHQLWIQGAFVDFAHQLVVVREIEAKTGQGLVRQVSVLHSLISLG